MTSTSFSSVRSLILVTVIITLASAMSSCSGDGSGSHLHDANLESLNKTLRLSDTYLRLKEAKLDSVKASLSEDITPRQRWETYVNLSEAYRQMDVDSALSYAVKALNEGKLLKDSLSTLSGDLAFIDALSTAGIFPPALHKLDSVQHLPLTVPEKINLLKTARRCYSYIMTWGGNNEYYVSVYRRRYTECDDSLLHLLPETDSFRQFIFCERLVSHQQWNDARPRLESLLASLPQESNLYGMAAYQLASVYRNNGDFTKYASYLALAAESDIKGCVREGLALPTLANLTYAHGDIDNAFRYVNHTLEDANSGNIRMHTAAIAPIIPLIDSTIQQRSKEARSQLISYFVISMFLFTVTIILLIYTFKSLKRQRLNQARLESTSRKLESYIGNFIGLCSNYAARLDQLSKLVTRKIAAGQSDELVKLISTGKFAEDDNEEFFRLIDKALLDIFPNFVEQINSLLLPDRRITLEPDQPLSPELRIYAFVRLGVDQSNRIAQILGYSVNTVYAYRNRMRNRAADREHFDTLVASLDSVSNEEWNYIPSI